MISGDALIPDALPTSIATSAIKPDEHEMIVGVHAPLCHRLAHRNRDRGRDGHADAERQVLHEGVEGIDVERLLDQIRMINHLFAYFLFAIDEFL